MRPSPRQRRLESDLRALQRLRIESSIFDFAGSSSEPGGVIDTYIVRFEGPSFYRTPDRFEIGIGREHEVMVRLGAAYPRQAPSLAWRTPIFHPNISTSGAVCLGGYSTFWVPSLHLDQLCEMLWDMIRLQNFDVKSPYNREAAKWLAAQEGLKLPLDERPLRDSPGASPIADAMFLAGRASAAPPAGLAPGTGLPPTIGAAAGNAGGAPAPSGFAGAGAAGEAPRGGANAEVEIVTAEVVIVEQPEILFIE